MKNSETPQGIGREQWITSANRLMKCKHDADIAAIHYGILMDEIDKLVYRKEQLEEGNQKMREAAEILSSPKEIIREDGDDLLALDHRRKLRIKNIEEALALLEPFLPEDDD